MPNRANVTLLAFERPSDGATSESAPATARQAMIACGATTPETSPGLVNSAIATTSAKSAMATYATAPVSATYGRAILSAFSAFIAGLSVPLSRGQDQA